jgi:hypothetical protein
LARTWAGRIIIRKLIQDLMFKYGLKLMWIKTSLGMGLLTFIASFFPSCSDRRSAFKPGFLAASGYYVHQDKVYFYGGFNNATAKELIGADAKSFEVLSEISDGKESVSLFARDDKHVYYSGVLLEGGDPLTFRVLSSELAKDKNLVFFRTFVLSRDPGNFAKIRDGFYKDSRHAFMADRIISDDPGNFSFLETMDGITYWMDSHGIIANDIRIDSADVNTFWILRYGYSADKDHVYMIEDASLKVLAGIDPKTFRVVSRYYTMDASRVYWRGKVLPDSDPENFKILNEEVHCSHDGKRAYHWNNIILNVDPSEFPEDKQCKYCTEKKVVF